MIRDHLKLQAIILLWSFTAILGALIELSSESLVIYRTSLAALCLLIWLRSRCRIPFRDALSFTATGFIIGAHWLTFFQAVKIANVSICMIGIATTTLWTALLEPIMIKKRRLRPIDVIFGVIIIIGVYFIYKNELSYSDGFIIAILSAFLAALFSVFNDFHIKKANHLVITYYEMLGASLFAFVYLTLNGGKMEIPPRVQDWLWIFVLSIFCTVIAFSQSVELLKRLSVFAINFANNLEPVYGILLAFLILKDHHSLNPNFYTGAGIILLAICSYPIVRKRIVAT